MSHKSPRYQSVRIVIIALALVCLASWTTFVTYSGSSSRLRSNHTGSATRGLDANLFGPTKSSEASQARVREAYRKLPLSFEANQGQADNRVKFLSRGNGYTLFLTSTEAVLALKEPATLQDHRQSAAKDTAVRAERAAVQRAVLRMKLVGGNSAPQAKGQAELPGKSSYFIGNDPSKWRTNVANYARVQYEDVYPGISLEYYGDKRQLEYDFVIAPGADPHAIKLAFGGAGRIRVAGKGDLVFRTPRGEVRQRKPVVYQEVNGAKQMLDGSYVIREKNQVGFAVTEYDASKPLVIDPVFQYSTYLGGSGEDDADAIAVDSSGNTYIGGVTSSINFPTTTGAYQTLRIGSDYDGYVTKINATGSALVYSTYIGGHVPGTFSLPDEFLNSIAVDSAGNAYIAGSTGSSDFPTTPSAFSTSLHGGPDAFFTKLNSTGSALLYSTYLGGSGNDNINPIAVDSAGNAYVTGFTTSGNFPTTAGAYMTIKPIPGPIPGGGSLVDAFVAKLDPTASGAASLVYSTYLGGGGNDIGFGIAVDSTGAAYVSGGTRSRFFPTTPGALQFPTTPGAFQTTFGGGPPCPSSTCGDAFVTKLNPAGSALVYSTYLGGSGADFSFALAIDASGNAYVTGGTYSSTDFPTTSGAFQTVFGGFGSCLPPQSFCGDAFLTKLNPTGSGILYSTFFGGSSGDGGFGIAVNSSGQAYISGMTSSTDLPIKDAVDLQPTFGGGNTDAFLVKLNPAGTASSDLVYSTYLGGSGDEIVVIPTPGSTSTFTAGGVVALDSCGNPHVAGITSSTDFPTKNPYQSFNAGFIDSFVAKISEDTTPPTITCPPDKDVGNDPGQCSATVDPGTATATDNCPGTTVTGVRSDGGGLSDSYPVGTTTITWTATDSGGNSSSCTQKITVRDTEKPTITCPADMTVPQDSAYGAIVNFSPPTANDNCPGVTTTCIATSGSNFPLGTTTVTCTARDASSNTASCSFKVTVVPPTSTTGVKSTDGGFIQIPGGIGTFGIVAMASSTGFVKGDVEYQDHVTGMNLKSTMITAIVVAGTHARIFGNATINGSGSYDFVVDVDDLGEPGIGADKFGIQVSNGYTAGPSKLSGGNIQIHN